MESKRLYANAQFALIICILGLNGFVVEKVVVLLKDMPTAKLYLLDIAAKETLKTNQLYSPEIILDGYPIYIELYWTF